MVALVGLALASVAAVVVSTRGPTRTRTPTHTLRPTHTTHGTAEIAHVILSPVGKDDYDVRLSGDLVTASSQGTLNSGNVRIAFWYKGERASVDQRSCVVWQDPTGKSQPGMALRIDPGSSDHPTRALIVTQNLWAGAIWQFYVLGMKSDEPAAQNAFGSIDVLKRMTGPDGKLSTGPWHVCAQVIGREFSIKTWLMGDPEPAWTSKSGVWHLTVPADWVYSGHAGAYVGHIKPGAFRQFANLTTTDLG